MNMFARFDKNPAMTLQDIKETKRYGQTDARTDKVKTVYPPQTKYTGGINIIVSYHGTLLMGHQSIQGSIYFLFSRPKHKF